MSDAASLFGPAAGGTWLPTELARGPWSPDALHGGPVAALLAGAAEDLDGGAWFPSRVTVELLRPVPLVPLAVEATLIRPGRKVQLVQAEASIAGGGTVVARALCLRMRITELDLPELHAAPPPGPDRGAPTASWREDVGTAFHNEGVEHRFVAGRFDEPGPATDWIRLRHPVVPDRDPSPLQRVVAAADFGNGVSGVVPPDQWSFVNPDLTVSLHRLPAGEWVCLDAVTYAEPAGVGLAESALFDERGRIGRAVQTLFVDRAV